MPSPPSWASCSPLAGVYIHKTIHVANTELLDVVEWLHLPLGTKTTQC